MPKQKKTKASAKNNTTTKAVAKRITKEDLFLEAYFRHGCNGTRAALEVFDIGSKGGSKTEAARRSTASVVAMEYLRKPSVQRAIDERLYKLDVSKAWVINTYQEMINDREIDPKVRKDLLRDMANMHGIDITKDETPTQQVQQQGVQVFLNVPSPPQDVAVDTPA